MTTTSIINTGITARYMGKSIEIKTPLSSADMNTLMRVFHHSKSAKVTTAIREVFKAATNSYGWIVFEDVAYAVNGGYVEMTTSVQGYLEHISNQGTGDTVVEVLVSGDGETEEVGYIFEESSASPTQEIEASSITRPDGYEPVEQAQERALRNYVPGDTFHVYGSTLRPMSAVWAHIPQAVFIQASQTIHGLFVHTFIVVPYELDAKIVASYELEKLYGPIIWKPEAAFKEEITLVIQLLSKVEMRPDEAATHIEKYFPGNPVEVTHDMSTGMVSVKLSQSNLTDGQRDWLHLSTFSAVYINSYTVHPSIRI